MDCISSFTAGAPPDATGPLLPSLQPGRRCRYLQAEGHATFCEKHSRHRRGTPRLHQRLLHRFCGHIFLGNIALQLARKRIARSDAVALASNSQLMINSPVAMEREQSANLNYYRLPMKPPYSSEDARATEGWPRKRGVKSARRSIAAPAADSSPMAEGGTTSVVTFRIYSPCTTRRQTLVDRTRAIAIFMDYRQNQLH
jgi:hypothetical protein